MSTEIKLGHLVRDALSGFTGIAASRIEQMNGNVQFAVQPKLKADATPGEYPDGMSMDFHTLEFVNDGLIDKVTAPGPTTIDLGDKVRCTITGIEGIAIQRTTFMNGCIYYGVQEPAAKDKQTGLTVIPDRLFLMQSCLEKVKPAVVTPPKAEPSTAGRVPGGPATRMQRQS